MSGKNNTNDKYDMNIQVSQLLGEISNDNTEVIDCNNLKFTFELKKQVKIMNEYLTILTINENIIVYANKNLTMHLIIGKVKIEGLRKYKPNFIEDIDNKRKIKIQNELREIKKIKENLINIKYEEINLNKNKHTPQQLKNGFIKSKKQNCGILFNNLIYNGENDIKYYVNRINQNYEEIIKKEGKNIKKLKNDIDENNKIINNNEFSKNKTIYDKLMTEIFIKYMFSDAIYVIQLYENYLNICLKNIEENNGYDDKIIGFNIIKNKIKVLNDEECFDHKLGKKVFKNSLFISTTNINGYSRNEIIFFKANGYIITQAKSDNKYNIFPVSSPLKEQDKTNIKNITNNYKEINKINNDTTFNTMTNNFNNK